MNLNEHCPKSEFLYCWLSIEPDSFSKLEPYAGKLARTVLRGNGTSNGPRLPDHSMHALDVEQKYKIDCA